MGCRRLVPARHAGRERARPGVRRIPRQFTPDCWKSRTLSSAGVPRRVGGRVSPNHTTLGRNGAARTRQLGCARRRPSGLCRECRSGRTRRDRSSQRSGAFAQAGHEFVPRRAGVCGAHIWLKKNLRPAYGSFSGAAARLARHFRPGYVATRQPPRHGNTRPAGEGFPPSARREAPTARRPALFVRANMKLICSRRSHDRGPCPDEAEAIVTVPWTVMHRVDQPNQARDLF